MAGELALEDCGPGVILRMKFIGAVGWASAREKSPDVAESGKGGGGWAWELVAVRANVWAVFAGEWRGGWTG